MRPLSRRDFLRYGAAAGAVAAANPLRLGRAATFGPTGTTLDGTIAKGSPVGAGSRGSYYALTTGPGEPRILREDLGVARGPGAANASLLHFVHMTDIHIVDAQSPARVEWFDRYSDEDCSSIPFQAAFRPQETLTVQTLEAMVRAIRAAAVSPVTGEPIAFAMCTGDNIDNEQYNELRWFIDTMDGGMRVTPNSGASNVYEGVQALSWGDEEYWHPDAIQDKYKRFWGFPDYPGLLEQAIVGFDATGIGVPWYQTFGNHDGLMQGNAPRNEAFNAAAVGAAKVGGPPPGLDPCTQFELFRSNPAALLTAPAHVVAPDPNRRVVRRSEYIAEHFTTTTDEGHGLGERNKADGTAYYHKDFGNFRVIALDSIPPGGLPDGSIGQIQLEWMVECLIEAHSTYVDAAGQTVTTGNADKIVVLVSHHGLRSMTNENDLPDPSEPGANDYPRYRAGDIEPILHRFPNVVAWVSGHTHNNVVDPRRGASGGFWDICTAAHIDWTVQSRLIEFIDNGDGTLSIMGTMIDSAAPVTPSGTTDPVLRLASIQRELAANDPHYGFASKGPGDPEDRNVELVVRNPLGAGLTHASSARLWLPTSPGQIAGALALSGVAAVIRRRMENAAR